MDSTNICILKLKNGTELVGDIVSDSLDKITINSPLQIDYKYMPGNMFPIILLKAFILLAKDNVQVVFDKAEVFAVVPARESFAKYYNIVSSSHDDMKIYDKALNNLVYQTMPVSKIPDMEKQSLFRSILENYSVTGVKLN